VARVVHHNYLDPVALGVQEARSGCFPEAVAEGGEALGLAARRDVFASFNFKISLVKIDV
jgi:hypothetical protein